MNDKTREVVRTPGSRSLAGNETCIRPWRARRERKVKSAHEVTGKIGARPQIGQWKRKGMIENIELHATFPGKPVEQLLPGGRRLWIDRIHSRIGDVAHVWMSRDGLLVRQSEGAAPLRVVRIFRASRGPTRCRTAKVPDARAGWSRRRFRGPA